MPKLICIAIMAAGRKHLEVVWRADGRSDFRSKRIGSRFVRYPSSKVLY